jgi:HKD family nuclease
VNLTLISQPFDNGDDLKRFLGSLATDKRVTELTIVVAWAKRSGFRQVGDALVKLRQRGVHITMIVGIDAGGATRQGLELVMEHSDEAFVYHVAGRTFHPKMYFGDGDAGFIAFIGSNNLTRGGAVENFELGVVVDGDPSKSEDDAFRGQLRTYVQALRADTQVCLPLDEATLEAIVLGYAIGDEDALPPQHGDDSEPTAIEPGGADPSQTTAEAPVFGRSQHQLRRGKAVGAGSGGGLATPVPSAGPKTGAVTPGPRGGQVVRRWVKELKKSDAQRLGGNSNPTGHLTLVRGRNPLNNAALWFRNTFFTGQPWHTVPEEPGRERVTVEMEVVIDGVSTGTELLVVDYNPKFESGQKNRVTTLRWGDDLGEYLHHVANRTGDFVTLERLSDGKFRLTIDSDGSREPIP